MTSLGFLKCIDWPSTLTLAIFFTLLWITEFPLYAPSCWF